MSFPILCAGLIVVVALLICQLYCDKLDGFN
jgi:hypothetical protein